MLADLTASSEKQQPSDSVHEIGILGEYFLVTFFKMTIYVRAKSEKCGRCQSVSQVLSPRAKETKTGSNGF